MSNRQVNLTEKQVEMLEEVHHFEQERIDVIKEESMVRKNGIIYQTKHNKLITKLYGINIVATIILLGAIAYGVFYI